MDDDIYFLVVGLFRHRHRSSTEDGDLGDGLGAEHSVEDSRANKACCPSENEVHREIKISGGSFRKSWIVDVLPSSPLSNAGEAKIFKPSRADKVQGYLGRSRVCDVSGILRI